MNALSGSFFYFKLEIYRQRRIYLYIKNMIYITGDLHNTIDMTNLSAKRMRKYCSFQNVNYEEITNAIVLGDFGLPWYECHVDSEGIHPEDKDDRYLLKWLIEKPFNILAVMGNHDNYAMIEKLPEVEMFGNKVLKVSKNIFYLKRGHFYNIEGHKFLALGGAESHDKESRKLNVNLWEQELWSEEEEKDCLNRINEYIEKFGNEVDYIVSHTGPIEGIACIESSCLEPEYREIFQQDRTVRFNNKIDSLLAYKKWFFGHWHTSWGYDNRKTSKYIPLFSSGFVITTPETVKKEADENS